MNLRGELVEAAPVGEGLVNSVYRLTLRRPHAIYALRVHAGDTVSFQRELHLLASLENALPVPRVLLADGSRSRFTHAYVVYPWIEGISLNHCRRASAPEVLLALAGRLGELLARVAASDVPPARDHARSIAHRLEVADRLLQSGHARVWLGDAMADALRTRLVDESSRLPLLDHATDLVHGDLGGRNVLVRQRADGAWTISGLLDWECAATGSPLWDVGSLFRYHRRYSTEFRDRFAGGYRAAGGELPDDWWLVARLLDATRLIGILEEDRELPSVFAECRELIEDLTFQDPHPSAR